MRKPVIDRHGLTVPRQERHYKPRPNKRAIDHNYPEEEKTSSLKYWLYFLLSLISGGNILFIAAHALTLVGVSFWLSCSIAFATIFSTSFVFRNLYKDLRYDPEHRGQHITKLGLLILGGYLVAHFAFIAIMAMSPGANILISMLYIAAATSLGIHLANFTCNTVLPWIFHQGKQFLRFLRKSPKNLINIPEKISKALNKNTLNFQMQLHENDTLKKLEQLGLNPRTDQVSDPTKKEKADQDFAKSMQFRLATYLIARKEHHMTAGPLSPVRRNTEIQRCNRAMSALLQGNSSRAIDLYLRDLQRNISILTEEVAAMHSIKRALENVNITGGENRFRAIDELLRIICEIHPPKDNQISPDSIYFKIDKIDCALRRIHKANQNGTLLTSKEKMQMYRDYLNKYLILDKKHTDLIPLLEELVDVVLKILGNHRLTILQKLYFEKKLPIQEIKEALRIKLQTLERIHPSLYKRAPHSARPDITDEHTINEVIAPLEKSLSQRSMKKTRACHV